MNMPIRILAVAGSLQRDSITRVIVRHLAAELSAANCVVDVLDFLEEPLALYNPDTAYDLPGFPQLKVRVENADVLILGTPDYHGSIGSAMKTFLDHFWHEFAGKLFVTIVASHEKGLTVTDQLRTVARQCYAWVLPYGVSVMENADVQEGRIVNESLLKRLAMLARDARVYGEVLARQRKADLACDDSCFMAKHRRNVR
jgi:NAD(P)H-dependent FMN reductase